MLLRVLGDTEGSTENHRGSVEIIQVVTDVATGGTEVHVILRTTDVAFRALRVLFSRILVFFLESLSLSGSIVLYKMSNIKMFLSRWKLPTAIFIIFAEIPPIQQTVKNCLKSLICYILILYPFIFLSANL